MNLESNLYSSILNFQFDEYGSVLNQIEEANTILGQHGIDFVYTIYILDIYNFENWNMFHLKIFILK